MLRPPLFYCLLDFKYIRSFLLSFLPEITLTNIYLNLTGLFTLKVPKCIFPDFKLLMVEKSYYFFSILSVFVLLETGCFIIPRSRGAGLFLWYIHSTPIFFSLGCELLMQGKVG